MSEARRCRLGVSFGRESELYSFPEGNPMNSSRTTLFADAIGRLAQSSGSGKLDLVEPIQASEKDLTTFHAQEYVDFVKASSRMGEGYLDYGDTPSFKGVYEASLYPVGNTLNGLDLIIKGKFDHFFNPVGGLHHARKERAGGFCVFNDVAIAISRLLEMGMKRVAYVDIDAHHGDGVFYSFESDPRVVIGDVHEDGRFLYPGTGSAAETGRGDGEGTKLNIPMAPGSGDAEFIESFDRIANFVRGFEPEFVLFQCGADSLLGDPIAQLKYTPVSHAYAAKKLHDIAHEFCQGRILAMGGGGYNPLNVSGAWTAVAKELAAV
ncbi:MAG: acetoin utilization protein AcuC [Thaumarchaeota archaeon]|nr:acetoin utilization protein AcuC [Nitrososphaerota archaeon]